MKDEALAQTVNAALAQDQRLSGLPIVVRASGGQVYLKGKVDTEEQKDLVTMVVLGVGGIRGVISDELEVREAGG